MTAFAVCISEENGNLDLRSRILQASAGADLVQLAGAARVGQRPGMMSEIIRVFPGRTTMTPEDPLAFVGFPPFAELRPADPETPVFVSVVFKWMRERAERIAESWRMYYRDVRVGGPAYDDLGSEFTPGMF